MLQDLFTVSMVKSSRLDSNPQDVAKVLDSGTWVRPLGITLPPPVANVSTSGTTGSASRCRGRHPRSSAKDLHYAT